MSDNVLDDEAECNTSLGKGFSSRCSFHNFLFVLEIANEQHKAVWKATIFGHFTSLKCPKALDLVLVCSLVETYDKEKNSFRLYKHLVPFGVPQVGQFLGLPVKGEKVLLGEGQGSTVEASIHEEYFKGEKKVATKQEVLKELTSKTDPKSTEDFVKIWLAVLMATFPPPTTGFGIKKRIWVYVDRLSEMSKYK